MVGETKRDACSQQASRTISRILRQSVNSLAQDPPRYPQPFIASSRKTMLGGRLGGAGLSFTQMSLSKGWC